jgi:NCS1 family nucleobase:cation symporter-1
VCRNAPDFASRAKTPAAALLPQLISVPLTFSLVSFIGIIVSSSSVTIYGEAVWSPIDLLGKFLDDSPSHATRFGVSFTGVHMRTRANISSIFFRSGSFLRPSLSLRYLAILSPSTQQLIWSFSSLGNYILASSPFESEPAQDQYLGQLCQCGM